MLEKEILQIRDDVKDIKEVLHNIELSQEKRLTKLETVQKGVISFSTLVFTGIITFLVNLMGEIR